MGNVRKRVRYDDRSKGKGNNNSMHDKSLYEVQCHDGMTKQMEANTIAENMMSQVDSEGHQYQVMTEMTDHKKDDSAISKVKCFIKSSHEKVHWKRTTRGCKILVEWKYGSVDWVPLKDIKQSNRVDLAE